jgi:predicted transcriptional regulator
MHRNILDITEEIIKILKKNKELSTRQISLKIKSHRAVVLKSLEFLKRINYVKETKDNKNKVDTRLFSLIKK